MTADGGWKGISLADRVQTLKKHSWASLCLETGALYRMSNGTSLDVLLDILNAVTVQISVSLQDRFEANIVKYVHHLMQFC